LNRSPEAVAFPSNPGPYHEATPVETDRDPPAVALGSKRGALPQVAAPTISSTQNTRVVTRRCIVAPEPKPLEQPANPLGNHLDDLRAPEIAAIDSLPGRFDAFGTDVLIRASL
jgi:hypothetical protein